MTRLNGRMGGAVLALGMFLLTAMSPAVQAGTACAFSVTPDSGPPGTAFMFTGSGWTPTTLTLTQDGKAPRVVPLDLGTDDPFSFPLVATQKDVGKWKVVASNPTNPAPGWPSSGSRSADRNDRCGRAGGAEPGAGDRGVRRPGRALPGLDAAVVPRVTNPPQPLALATVGSAWADRTR